MTFKLATSGGVGQKIKKYLDVAVKGGPASSVTFVLPNDEAANRFAPADQGLGEGDRAQRR